ARRHPPATPFAYTTLFRSLVLRSLHDDAATVRSHLGLAEPMSPGGRMGGREGVGALQALGDWMTEAFLRDAGAERLHEHAPRWRSEEHTSELQSREKLVCR